VKGIEVQQIIVRGCASKKCSLLLGQSRGREREVAGSGRTLWAFCPFPPGWPVKSQGDALTQKTSFFTNHQRVHEELNFHNKVCLFIVQQSQDHILLYLSYMFVTFCSA
jgi:hypothetical protein